jgi:hypothetical protein
VVYRREPHCTEISGYYCDHASTTVVFPATLAVATRTRRASAPAIAHRVIFEPHNAMAPH